MDKYFENEDVIELYKMLKESIFKEIDKTNPMDRREVVQVIAILEKQLNEDLEEVFNLLYTDYVEEKLIERLVKDDV